MLSLFTALPAFEVEFAMGAEPVMFMEGQPVQIEMAQDSADSLMGLLEKMSSVGAAIPMQRAMTNPCEMDMARTRCRDAACLKAHFEALSPSCAMFVFKSQTPPAPSPSPEPQAAAPQGESYYSVSYMGPDGKMHTESGSLDTKAGRTIEKEFEGEMQEMFEQFMPGLGELFGAPARARAAPPSRQPEAQRQVTPAADKKTTHPCEREVDACMEELGGNTAREAVQQCLVKHYSSLTADCKCFLHQVMGDELEKQVPGAKAPEQPRMRTVAVLVQDEADAHHAHGKPREHRASCALFMILLLVSVFLIARRLCLCCCAPKPKHVAFVPPDAVVKMSVEPLVITKEVK